MQADRPHAINRSISCNGAPDNEGDAGVGAILIPGTPTGAMVGGSLMNSCFRPVETGQFTATDLVGLRELYGILHIQRWATQQGGFWDLQKWSAGDVTGDHKADLVNVFNDGGVASLDVHRQL